MKVNKQIWAAALSAVLFIGSMSTPALAFVDESAATADAEETTGTLPEVSIGTEIESGAAEADDSLFDTSAGEDEPENNTVFTPDGTGTVMDTATDADGKEFYTITTESGAVYYLIIDNERTESNVYFLNAVTEEDLLPLAEGSGDTTETDIPATVSPTPDTSDTPADDADTDTEDKAADTKAAANNKSLILIVIAVIAAGAAGYYLKIYKPKHMAPSYDEDEDDFDDDNYDDDDGYLDDDSDSEDYLYRDEEEDD